MTVLVYAWQWRSGPFRVAVWCINLRSDRTMQVIYSVDCVFCTPCTWQLGTEKMNNKIEKKKKKKGNIIPSLPFTSLPSHHTREYIPSSTQLSSWIPSFIRVIRYLVIKTLSYLYWLSTPYRVGSGGSLNIHRQVSHWPQLLPTDEWRARSPEYRP